MSEKQDAAGLRREEEGMDRGRSVQDVVLVTGPAGAGRTTAIHALEDLGFETIDNLPLSLLPRLLDGPPVAPLAIGCDPRTRDFSPKHLLATLDAIFRTSRYMVTLLYVDCAASVLLRRYNETRRRHPSSPHDQPRVGIERDLELLAPLRSSADILIDTTSMSPHDLKREMVAHFSKDGTGELAVTLQSFSFKKGAPMGVDMLLDVRFLRNPHWNAHLRPLDGRDAEVAAHVNEDENWAPFMTKLEDMMRFLLPAYRLEGKAYFSLAIGCTGGRHRSVMAVEALAKTLAREGWRVSIRHRDLVEVRGAANEPRSEVRVQ